MPTCGAGPASGLYSAALARPWKLMNSGRLCAAARSAAKHSVTMTNVTMTVNARILEGPFMAMFLPMSSRPSLDAAIERRKAAGAGSPLGADHLLFRCTKPEGSDVDIAGTIGCRKLRRAPRLV